MAGKRKRSNNAPEHNNNNSSSSGDDRDVAEGADHTEMEEAPVAPLSDCPFTIEYKQPQAKKSSQAANKAKKAKQAKQSQLAKRQKVGKGTGGPPPKQVLDQTVPEDMPATVFTINPKKKWDELKKYRNFVVGTENFALQEYIFVNHDNIPHGIDIPNVDDHKFWVARVLEIRAVDEAHVYLRVYWLYWPDELPGGREPYHGSKELIASNHMEIIDAMTVSGRANVKHWMELDEEDELPDLFWRQKFDYPTSTLMEVREHCKCHSYYNPDKMMLGCPHCGTWLHEECIIDAVKQNIQARLIAGEDPMPTPAQVTDVTDTAPDAEANESSVAKKGRGRKSILSSAVDAVLGPPSTPATNGKRGKGAGKTVKSNIKSMKGVEDSFDVTVSSESGSPRVIVKDLREDGKGTWEEDVICLLCEGVVA